MADNFYSKYSSIGGGGSGVTSLNSLTGALTLVAGTGITITPSGSNITIATTALLSAITSINTDATAAQTITVGTAGTDFAITNPGGGSHVLNLPTASASNRGALSSADWTTFNSKQSTLTLGNLTDAGTDGIVITGGSGAVIGSGTSIAQHVADTTHNGYLSNADWNTFNSKQASGNYITALTGDVTASGPGSAASTVAKIQGTTVSGTTGSTNVVFSSAPTMSNPVVGTQSQGDSSTKAASTAYVDVAIANAIAGVNPAVAVQAATTVASDTSSFTYNNGASGIGATLTGAVNTALTVDGYTFTALGQRLLVKNDTQSPSGAFNGIYYVTQVQTAILPLILTRALDYDMPSDINNTGAIPVINGTVNGTTTWVQTAQVVTVGTTPLVFVIFTKNPASYVTAVSVASANGFAGSSSGGQTPALTLTTSITGVLKGNSTAISAATSGTDYSAGTSALSTGILKSTTTTGALTIAVAGDFPTLNQNTTGTASNITASSNSTLTTLSALSLPATQLTGTLQAGQFPALTGDITTSAGALATTLATVNSNVGSFGSSTSIPSITVNAKGLITAASGNVVIAPAGTLSGTTLNSTVVSSSLTSLGTIATGVWNGTTIAVANGGSGQTTYTDGQLLIGNSSGNTLTKATLTAGAGVTITNGNGSITVASSGSAPVLNYTAQATTYAAVINDYITCSGASFVVTLPTAVGVAGKSITIKHNGTSLTQVYQINTTSSQTISGPAGVLTGTAGVNVLSSYTLGEVFIFTSDGANWQITDHVCISDAVAYTPTVTGFGTGGTAPTNISFYYYREGRYAYIYGTLTAGTVQAALGSFTLPGGSSLNTSVITINNTTAAAGMRVGTGNSNGAANGYTPIVTAPATSSTLVYTGNVFSGTNNLIPGNGSGNYASASVCSFEFRVAISGWQP